VRGPYDGIDFLPIAKGEGPLASASPVMTTARLLIGLVPITGGKIIYDGQELNAP
jgi:hypothetical protein